MDIASHVRFTGLRSLANNVGFHGVGVGKHNGVGSYVRDKGEETEAMDPVRDLERLMENVEADGVTGYGEENRDHGECPCKNLGDPSSCSLWAPNQVTSLGQRRICLPGIFITPLQVCPATFTS